MSDFEPVNSLEIQLRAPLQDRNTRPRGISTPLAAAPIWIFVRNYPELDGSDLIAPEGKNPEICVFKGPENSFIALYTAECRADEAFKKLNLQPSQFAIIFAHGYQVLLFVEGEDSDLLINLGLPECASIISTPTW